MSQLIALASTDPLWQRMVVAAVAPGVTVLLGGLVVWSVTSRVQEKRDKLARERAEAREDAESERQIRARDDALRHELVDLMTDSASALYLTEQHYWRAKKRVEQDPTKNEVLIKGLEDLRPELDAAYLKGRVSGESIENRLWGFFVSEEPRNKWHQVQDLLTVRYFTLIDEATDRLLKENAGDMHSRLSEDQLRNEPQLVLKTYRAALKEAVELVFSEDLRARSQEVNAPRPEA